VEYEPLWAAARRRLERNGLRLEGTVLRLGELTDGQRRAIAGLMGTSAAADRPPKVRLEALDQTLRRGAASVGLIEWLELVGGPLQNRPARRSQERAASEEAWRTTSDHPVLADRPELFEWLAHVRRRGLATRVAGSAPGGARLVAQALDVVSRLPLHNVTLAALAAEVTGDAHALDRGKPLATILSGALNTVDVGVPLPNGVDPSGDEHLHGEPADGGVGAPASDWRRRWARFGVICDELSVSVLALNVPARGTNLIAGTLSDHGSWGEPVRLTLRQLSDAVLQVSAGTLVRICENPSVMAHAATTLEGDAAPLVCVEGVPNTAAWALLDLLAADGCRFAYHGDFDWGGLRIATSVIDRYGAEPWRFGRDDYRSAVERGRLPLGSPPTGASAAWSRGLVDAMSEADTAVHEELVLDDLLADLASDDPGDGGEADPVPTR
jgi:uncharacterized protein (TIGR02679 family)